MDELKSDFMKTIEEVRVAEKQAEEMKSEAKTKSDQILKKAKEIVLRIKSENEQAVIEFKNEKLHAGSEEIEDEVKDIINKAKSEGDKIKSIVIDKKTLGVFLEEFLTTK